MLRKSRHLVKTRLNAELSFVSHIKWCQKRSSSFFVPRNIILLQSLREIDETIVVDKRRKFGNGTFDYTDTESNRKRPSNGGKIGANRFQQVNPIENITKNLSHIGNDDTVKQVTDKDNKSKRPDLIALESILIEIKKIRNEIDLISNAIPPLWSFQTIVESSDKNIGSERFQIVSQQRQKVYYMTQNLVDNLLGPLLKQNVIRPNGKHRREYTLIIEFLLQFYHHCLPFKAIMSSNSNNEGKFVSIYEKCYHLYQLLNEYKYVPTHAQCLVLVTAAAREGKWIEAATIYEDHINPDKTGYTPTFQSDDIYGAMIGLYVIAKAASKANTLPVENVMDGVLKLSMVSSQDTEMYVLAAGTALGHAKEWEALVSYLETSSIAKEMGQPLVAAAMQACIMNNQHEKALELYDELVQSQILSDEWQWGGGQFKLNPVCRDLAMRALGGINVTPHSSNPISSEIRVSPRERALEFFKQIVNDVGSTMSIEALVGIIRACKHEGRWEDTVHIWMAILEKERLHLKDPDRYSSILSTDTESFQLFRVDRSSKRQQNAIENDSGRHCIVSELGYVLDQVMQACNASKKFAVAWLCLRLFEVTLLDSYPEKHLVYYEYVENMKVKGKPLDCKIPIHLSIVPTIASVQNVDELLATSMISLCGLESPGTAMDLYNSIDTAMQRSKSAEQLTDIHLQLEEEGEAYHKTFLLNVYSNAEVLRNRQQTTTVYPVWEGIAHHINQLTKTLSHLEGTKEKITIDDSRKLSSILAQIMRMCTGASQPETGINLLKWTESRNIEVDMLPQNEMRSAVGQLAPSEFDLAYPKRNSPLLLIDPLLASVAEAYRESGCQTTGENIVTQYLTKEEQFNHWFLTLHEVLKNLLTRSRHDDAMALFRNMLAQNRSPDLFCTVAHALLEKKDYRAVSDLYKLSLASGCLSEELSVLAIKSTVASKTKNKFPIVRSIIAETAKHLGVGRNEWIEKKYWSLKRIVGENNARFLMGWNNLQMNFVDELQFAIETMEKRCDEGLTPKIQVIETIILGVSNFERIILPEGTTGLPRIPRAQQDWIILLEAALEEAKLTKLINDPRIIDIAARAFLRLGHNEKCVLLVKDAISRGIQVSDSVIEDVLAVSKTGNLDGQKSKSNVL